MNPAEIHLITNHIALFAVAAALLLGAAGHYRKSDELTKAGLFALVLAALTVLPPYFSGEGAEELVEHLPGVVESAIHPHEEAAEAALIVLLLLGAGSAAVLGYACKTGVWAKKAATALLVLALPALGLMSYVAYLGGQIRHTELRPGGTPVEVPAGETDAD
jgi:uncharacterized membrane protein